jgi:mannose-6-phosphate isomerase
LNIPEIILFGPNRVWRTYTGGKVLDKLEGTMNARDTHFPEDWISSVTQAVNLGREAVTEGISEIEFDNRKMSFASLLKKYPVELLGENHFKKYGPNTQFLIKYLDSAIRLHIQAHPTMHFSRKFLNSNSGKTEAYVILETREEVKDPYIYLGFQKSPDKARLRNIIEKQYVDQLLSFFEKISVKPGDLFLVPGGLPHAIGEGIFMIEIMEPTDFVVRLEFERGGYTLPEEARFMGRDIDFALSMIDFSEITVEDVKRNYFCIPHIFDHQEGGYEEVLIGPEITPCFRIHRVTVRETFIKSADSFYVGIVTEGRGSVRTRTEQKILKRGDRFFIPHSQKRVFFSADDEMKIILTFPPL